MTPTNITKEQAVAALALPRNGARSVQIDGQFISVCALNRIVAAANGSERPPPPPVLPKEEKSPAPVVKPLAPLIAEGIERPPRLGAKISLADGTYEGDLTLERLLEFRAKLRTDLEMLDERLLFLKIDVLLKRRLEPVRQMAEVEPRCDIAADATKIKNDTAKLLAAANRLAQRGVL